MKRSYDNCNENIIKNFGDMILSKKNKKLKINPFSELCSLSKPFYSREEVILLLDLQKGIYSDKYPGFIKNLMLEKNGDKNNDKNEFSYIS